MTTVALVIGAYLVATTVMIAEDGVSYITRAQQCAKDPIAVIKSGSPGYPILIFMGHKLNGLFNSSSSAQAWAYTAQCVALFCRVLALVPLYYIGKLLVGGRKSFWAIVILIALPYPAAFGSDTLRDWPHILFLSASFLFLIWGARFGKWWMFAAAGMTAGLGHTMRPECAQVVIYGILWMLVRLFVPGASTRRLQTALLTLVLLAGFAVPAGFYMKAKGRIIPEKLERVISAAPAWESSGAKNGAFDGAAAVQTAGVPVDVLKALCLLGANIGDNLMYFFAVPLAIGLHRHFRKLRRILLTERLFVFILVVLYVVMMTMLCSYYGYISRRHCLPMVVLTIFYIPVGLRIIARQLCRMNCKSASTAHIQRQRWFLMLLAVGLAICIAKFARITPLRSDKQSYREVAEWLRKNTSPEDIIAISHLAPRIGFYAERTTRLIQTNASTISAGKVSSGSWCHVVGTFDGEDQKLYINGKPAASKKSGFNALSAGNDDLAIGRPSAGANSYFKGRIAEVRLYSKALSSEEVESLYNHKIPQAENSEMIGYWPLEGEGRAVNGRTGEGMTFDGIKDYIDLSRLGSGLDVAEITVSGWVKAELSDQMNWWIGNGAQFRMGIRNSKLYFWIRDRLPGHIIPAEAAYVVVEFTGAGPTEPNMGFNKKVQERYSVWVNKREKKTIAVFEVL
ncbi:MAG: glycosyltransferase family 39 protein [Sedimentisphaerales bacterium]|nr:glycosyltransferase family 39 protein [Sedimentisphaerales bacterium]